MLRRVLTITVVVLLACQLVGPVLDSPDVDRSGRVDLRDAIIAVKALSGTAADNGDLYSRLRRTVQVFRTTSKTIPAMSPDRDTTPMVFTSLPGLVSLTAVCCGPQPTADRIVPAEEMRQGIVITPPARPPRSFG